MSASALDPLSDAIAGGLAMTGLALSQGEARQIAIRTAPGIEAGPETMFRVASISKVAVGQAMAAALAESRFDWDTRLDAVLGWSPHPAITLGQLAGHASGMTDAAGYLVPPLVTLREFCEDRLVMAAPPGERFDYCNLGYVVLAAALEQVAQKPFAAAVAPFLPEGAGFNWEGVSPARRKDCLPIFRRDGANFLPQIDDVIRPVPKAPHPGPLSPQGGLRTSMEGLLSMAEALAGADTTRLWTTAQGATLGPAEVFRDYGPGLQIYEAPTFWPRPLYGHFGNAYGLRAGIWYDAEKAAAFAYALNGMPLGEEDDDFTPAERAIFDGLAALI